MICRSTSDLSLWVWIQFFPNCRITMTVHIVLTRSRVLGRPDPILRKCKGEKLQGPGLSREDTIHFFSFCYLLWIEKTKGNSIVVYYESRKWELKIRLMNEGQSWGIYMSHIHWIERQNKLEIPRDKDEVNKREIHECDGWPHDPDRLI